MSQARYDAIADWYDATLADHRHSVMPREAALELLGPPRGTLLDVGCGGGSHTAAFAAAGWETLGIDVSEEQLRMARERGCSVLLARAEELPFEDASFDAAVSMWTHTDIDDWAAAVQEVARVVRPGGVFVYVGVHPCFIGPHSLFVEGQSVPQFHPGYYRTSGRYDEAPGISATDLGARIGATHLPLAEFLQSFLDAGFALERVSEPGLRDFPIAVALRWHR